MTAGSGDFQRALDRFLAFDIREIEFVFLELRENSVDIDRDRRNLYFALEKRRSFAKVLNRHNPQLLRLACSPRASNWNQINWRTLTSTSTG